MSAVLAQQNDPGVPMKSTHEIDSWLILASLFVCFLLEIAAAVSERTEQKSQRLQYDVTAASV